MGELDGKVCVVTGATAGVGQEIARGLLAKGATVVVVARDAKKGAAVLAELSASTGNAHVQFVAADLSSMKSVRAAAAQIAAQHSKLHALIHNAAMIPQARKLSDEGLELAFAANTVAPLVFTRALLPALVASGDGRVVFLVGATEPIVMADLQLAQAPYNGWTAYQRTKYGSLMVLKHLADTVPKEVVVHGAFPGLVNTPGMDDAINANTGFNKLVLKVMRPFMRTPARGAWAPVWVASAPELSSSTGKLWTWKEPLGQIPKNWDDAGAATRLVAEIDRLLPAA